MEPLVKRKWCTVRVLFFYPILDFFQPCMLDYSFTYFFLYVSTLLDMLVNSTPESSVLDPSTKQMLDTKIFLFFWISLYKGTYSKCWLSSCQSRSLLCSKSQFFVRENALGQGRPKIRQSTIYYAGLLRRWDKRIVDQESDVPSIIFFIDLGHSKLFIFISVIL